MARLAKSLDVLRAQVNARWPDRNKGSDGWIGDTAHSARKSDHNPNSAGVVQALDITHDPRGGPDAGKLAEMLRLSRDPRIKYLISNQRICSGAGGQSPWSWRPYSGSNPHTKHVHISVCDEKVLYDSSKPWAIAPKPKPAPEPDEPAPLPAPPDVEPTPVHVPWWKKPFVWLGTAISGGVFGGATLSIDGQFFLGFSAFVGVCAAALMMWVWLVPPIGKLRKTA